jgi:predicted metalloprotease
MRISSRAEAIARRVSGADVEFDKDAKIDTSGIEDQRGATPGGGGLGGGKLGGGLLGLVVVLVLGFLGLNGNLPGVSGLTDDTGDSGSFTSSDSRALQEKCGPENPTRFEEADCRQSATFADLKSYWARATPDLLGAPYSPPRLVLFSGRVTTACGSATSAVGPFYCPGDQKIYIDLGFYRQLESQFGAPGEFAQAYVLAHEFGHHIQHLTGTEQTVRQAQQRNPSRANEYSIALELQADCYAGVWTKDAAGPGGLITAVSDADLKSALGAAGAVGDDRIQEQSGGRVNPETWTHGSAQQRETWFFTGYQTGDPRRCDTFSGAS